MNPARTEENLRQIIKYAKEVGPRNAALIAQYTGIPATTVRYSLKNILKRRGIEFNARANQAALGLRKYLFSFSFDERHTQNSEEVLRRMATGAYLEWYGKTLARGDYRALVALPTPHQASYQEFLEHLVESGILRYYKSRRMDWFRFRSLDENDYNFRLRRWEIDWQTLAERRLHIEEPPAQPETPFKADKSDLLILNELELDATQRLSKMTQKLNLTYRAVYYHHTEHVIGQGLVDKYTVYPSPAAQGDPWTLILHLLRGLSSDELVRGENVFHRVPFTWMDGYSGDEGLYAVFTFLPFAEMGNMLEFISEMMQDLRKKHSFELLSLAHSRRYTIPYEMMSENGVWGFDPSRVLEDVIAEPARRSVSLKK